MSAHRLLYISYLFPPSGSVGSPRAANFARYLIEHVDRLFVIAPSNPATPMQDASLLAKLPAQAHIERVWSPEPPYAFRDRIWKRLSPPRVRQYAGDCREGYAAVLARAAKWPLREAIQRLFCPDTQRMWVPFALRRACRVIEREGISAVLLNTPPYSSLEIAIALRRRYPELKMVLEIRDDWLGYYLQNFDTSLSAYKRRYAARVEREAIAAADFVVAVTPAQAANMRRRYPDQAGEKFLSVPNGYDPDQFAGFQPRRHSDGRMIVTYMGSVHSNPVYSPAAYLAAADGLPEQIRRHVETRFIGRVAIEAEDLLAGRQCAISRLGVLPQHAAIKQLEQTDYLLLVVNDATAHAGKLFDYMATGLPILALTPPHGEIAALLRETGTGWAVDPRDSGAIYRLLVHAWERLKNGGPALRPNWPAIRKFSWPDLVGKLVTSTGLGTCPTERQRVEAAICAGDVEQP